MNEPDRKTVRDILQNWRWYARDLPLDSAEIHYYTISPMFRDYAIPTPKHIRYDTESAEMVEEVMREMFKWRPKCRKWLIRYWLYIPNNQDLADAMGTSKRTVERKMAEAHDAFAKYWALLFYGS